MPTVRSEADALLAALDRAAVARRRRVARRGEQLFRRGDPVTSLFFVRSGRIRLERTLSDGSWVAIHVARAPALLAEASLFADRYHCDAVAEISSVVAELDRSEVDAALDSDPALCRLLLRRLATEVRDLRGRLELRSVRPVERRVLLALELDDGGERTVAARAAELGLAPETLSRTLAALERRGAIVRRGRSIRLVSGAPRKP